MNIKGEIEYIKDTIDGMKHDINNDENVLANLISNVSEIADRISKLEKVMNKKYTWKERVIDKSNVYDYDIVCTVRKEENE